MKKLSIFLILCLLCSVTVFAEEPVQPESIKIMLTSGQMSIGETQKLRVSITPANAENYELEYSSSNPEVATAAIGTVIANKEGTAGITVKIKDTDISDTVTVTVGDVVDNTDESVLVTDIVLDDDYFYLDRYDEKKITYDIVPGNSTNQNVTFTSLDTYVATVSSTGIVYAKRAGTAAIKVQSEDGNTVRYVTVIVYDEEDDSNIYGTVAVRRVDIYDGDDEVTDTIKIMVSQSKAFTASIYPETADDKRIRWKTADDDIAEIDDNGVVTGVSEGTTKIYAIARENGRQDVITVKITPYIRYPDSISIFPQENAVYESGQVVTFTPVFSPSDTTEKDLRWYVSGDSAIIDQNGNVTITSRGTATIKAYSADWKLSAEYTFEAVFNHDHFTQLGECFNVKANRPVIITFDESVNANSAKNNIFAATDESGNTNLLDIIISVEGRQVTVTPVNDWSADGCCVFIKEAVCDIYGNELGRNLKYKIENVRGVMGEKD